MGKAEGETMMTHDELLTKIDNFEPDDELDSVNSMNVLRAVVELHKPFGNSWNNVLNCRQCKSTEDEYNENYPCPTIQAIEKELA
jgi:hypothetical protein